MRQRGEAEEGSGECLQRDDLKVAADHGGRLTLEKGDDPKNLRRALKAAAGALNRRVRFPFRGEEGAVSFYLEKPRGRRPKGEAAPGRKRRGRPRKGE